MNVTEERIRQEAVRLGECLVTNGLKLSCAESCTGGWLSKIITDIPGSSNWFEAGIVSYSNASKSELLGVSSETITRFGAVSGETVEEMTTGLFSKTSADLAVSISGVAGPSGGTEEKPVGLVWLCWGRRHESVEARTFHFEGDREQIRLQSSQAAIRALLELAERI